MVLRCLEGSEHDARSAEFAAAIQWPRQPVFRQAEPWLRPPDEGTPMAKQPFGYCLNTATIMGQKLGIVEEINIASRAGYQGN